MEDEAITTESQLEVELRIIEQANRDRVEAEQLLVDKYEALVVINAKIEHAEGILSQANDQATHKAKECEALDVEIAQGELTLSDMQKVIAELEDVKRHAEHDTTQAVRTRDETIALAQHQANDTINSLNREITSLSLTIPSLKEQETSLSASIASKQSQIPSLEESIRALSASKQALTDDIEEKSTEYQSYDDLMVQKKGELSVTLNAIAHAKEEKASLLVQVDETRKLLVQKKEEVLEEERLMFKFRKTREAFEARVAFIKSQFEHAGIPWREPEELV